MNVSELIQEAGRLGLTLSRVGDDLHVTPARLCSPRFADTLRAHKSALLGLLRLPFCMLYSEILGETIFFCADEDTKAALVEAGASEWSIYTRYELQMLVAQNRIAPLTAAELRKVHEIKRTFNASITESLTNSGTARTDQ